MVHPVEDSEEVLNALLYAPSDPEVFPELSTVTVKVEAVVAVTGTQTLSTLQFLIITYSPTDTPCPVPPVMVRAVPVLSHSRL